MIQHTEIEQIPFIGQVVHFWPNPSQKFAAIVTETFPANRDDGGDLARPEVNLRIFFPSGPEFYKDHAMENVKPLDIESSPESFKDVWTFVNEFATLQTDDIDEETIPGTKANFWVGEDMSS